MQTNSTNHLTPFLILSAGILLLASCKNAQRKEQMNRVPTPNNSVNSFSQVRLSQEQIKLGNIQIDTIIAGEIGDRATLTGTLNFDQQKLTSVSTRIEGRIDSLYFKKSGEYVRKGDKLYDLYSEVLNNAKQEYITALLQQATIGNSFINYGVFVETAKNKLLLWGMSTEQIDNLAKVKQSSPLTSFYSTESGYITAINVQEGSFVMEGSTVIQLADLSTLWAEAQVYTTQLSLLNKTADVEVILPDMNDLRLHGKVAFANPEINPDSRINLVRVTVSNENNQLHPGMPVYILVTSKQHHSITLPIEAVLFDSKGANVWTQVKPGIFAIRMVQTGITENNTIEILSGLKNGDQVVISGAYLINSEFIFQNGASPMQGMDMGKMKM